MAGDIAISDDEKFEIERDVRTLKEAQLLRADEGRLNKAMAMMNEEMGALSKAAEEIARDRFKNTEFKS